MKENMPAEEKELICINVEKVYDWVVKEMSFEYTPTCPITFQGLAPATSLTGATVTCQVTPSTTNPVVVLSRENRHFTIDGTSVCLQQLSLQNNFDVTIYVTLPNGTMYTSDCFNISRCEHIVMNAPTGTNVDVTYTALNGFVCSTGTFTNNNGTITFDNLAISITVCQSIQSTFPVTVEFLADYCEPRADLPFSCPPPSRPKTNSLIFP